MRKLKAKRGVVKQKSNEKSQSRDMDFVTTWRILGEGSVILPVCGTFTIDWGDGCVEEFRGLQSGKSPVHKYGKRESYVNMYTVRVSSAAQWHGKTCLDELNTAQELELVLQWGTTKWTTMHRMFKGCINLRITALDAPDLSGVTDMSFMFSNCHQFNGLIEHWDVSGVQDMGYLFFDTPNFNQALNDWDVSSVTNMQDMFSYAVDYNHPLDDWDVSSVGDMSAMFAGAVRFNQLIGGWDVKRVKHMQLMFRGADLFNQALSAWDVSSVINMANMFNGASVFNQSLNGWDVGKVRSMNRMFHEAFAFNQPLDKWDVYNVNNFDDMFERATAFKQDIRYLDYPLNGNTENMFGTGKSLVDYSEPYFAQDEKDLIGGILKMGG